MNNSDNNNEKQELRRRTMMEINDSLEDLSNPEPLNVISHNCKEEFDAYHRTLKALMALHPESRTMLLELDDQRQNLEYIACQEHMKYSIEFSIK